MTERYFKHRSMLVFLSVRQQEAMWNEDQVETRCSLLENDVEDLTEEVSLH